MNTTAAQKKAIDLYYKELAAYHDHKVTHKTAGTGSTDVWMMRDPCLIPFKD